jgi:DNA-binding IclR family transcriptional regulator
MAATDVKVAARILDLLEVFSRERAPLLLTELAELIGAPKSSCSELVATLRRRGYLYALGRRRGFYPTRRWLVHAREIAAADPVLARLEEPLARLREQTGETVIVGQWQADDVLYLDVLEGTHTIRYTAMAGDHKPLHSSAIGKAFLAHLPEAERARTVEGLALERITPATLVTPAALLGDLAVARERGYCATRGENVADVMAIARVVEIGDGAYGIAVAGPLQRMAMCEADLAQALLGVVAELETPP